MVTRLTVVVARLELLKPKDKIELLERMHTQDHLFDSIAAMIIACEGTCTLLIVILVIILLLVMF